MRKLLVSLVAASTAFAFATPAAAQYFPPQRAYGYGYNNGGQYQRDLQQLRYQMDNLARSGRLTGREARDLQLDLRGAEQMIYRAGRNGIQPWQARRIEQQINSIRYELRRYADNDGNRYNRYDRYGRRY
jgi:hypothetical protein